MVFGGSIIDTENGVGQELATHNNKNKLAKSRMADSADTEGSDRSPESPAEEFEQSMMTREEINNNGGGGGLFGDMDHFANFDHDSNNKNNGDDDNKAFVLKMNESMDIWKSAEELFGEPMFVPASASSSSRRGHSPRRGRTRRSASIGGHGMTSLPALEDGATHNNKENGRVQQAPPPPRRSSIAHAVFSKSSQWDTNEDFPSMSNTDDQVVNTGNTTNVDGKSSSLSSNNEHDNGDGEDEFPTDLHSSFNPHNSFNPTCLTSFDPNASSSAHQDSFYNQSISAQDMGYGDDDPDRDLGYGYAVPDQHNNNNNRSQQALLQRPSINHAAPVVWDDQQADSPSTYSNAGDRRLRRASIGAFSLHSQHGTGVRVSVGLSSASMHGGGSGGGHSASAMAPTQSRSFYDKNNNSNKNHGAAASCTAGGLTEVMALKRRISMGHGGSTQSRQTMSIGLDGESTHSHSRSGTNRSGNLGSPLDIGPERSGGGSSIHHLGSKHHRRTSTGSAISSKSTRSGVSNTSKNKLKKKNLYSGDDPNENDDEKSFADSDSEHVDGHASVGPEEISISHTADGAFHPASSAGSLSLASTGRDSGDHRDKNKKQSEGHKSKDTKKKHKDGKEKEKKKRHKDNATKKSSSSGKDSLGDEKVDEMKKKASEKRRKTRDQVSSLLEEDKPHRSQTRSKDGSLTGSSSKNMDGAEGSSKSFPPSSSGEKVKVRKSRSKLPSEGDVAPQPDDGNLVSKVAAKSKRSGRSKSRVRGEGDTNEHERAGAHRSKSIDKRRPRSKSAHKTSRSRSIGPEGDDSKKSQSSKLADSKKDSGGDSSFKKSKSSSSKSNKPDRDKKKSKSEKHST